MDNLPNSTCLSTTGDTTIQRVTPIEFQIHSRCARSKELVGVYEAQGLESASSITLRCGTLEGLSLNPGQIKGVPTGVTPRWSAEDSGSTLMGLVFAHPSLIRDGVFIIGGVIPLYYDQPTEIAIPLYNAGDTFMHFRPGDTIAQFSVVHSSVIQPTYTPQ